MKPESKIAPFAQQTNAEAKAAAFLTSRNNMIRFRRLTPQLLNAWLIDQQLPTTHQRYRLRLWRESRDGLAPIQPELIAYMEEAFEDARRRIRRGFEDALSPFNDPANDPAANYPALLHRVTLQGYLGETLAVLAIEHWGAHGHNDWIVPAFLFRLHDEEFQHLEFINERLLAGQPFDPDEQAEMRPGRTGDDGLAFRMNADHIITDILTLEAKCLLQNSNAKIQEAYGKLATAGLRPSGIRELINLLEEYNTAEAQIWEQALVKLWRDGYRVAGRHDGMAYTVGRRPVRNGRQAWMATDAPPTNYNVRRKVEAMEFQIEDLPGVIDAIYRGNNG